MNLIGVMDTWQDYWEKTLPRDLAYRIERYPNKKDRESIFGPDTTLKEARNLHFLGYWKQGWLAGCCGAKACRSFEEFNRVNIGITLFVSKVKAEKGEVNFSLGKVTELPLDDGTFMYIKTFSHLDENLTNRKRDVETSLSDTIPECNVASIYFSSFSGYPAWVPTFLEEAKKYKYLVIIPINSQIEDDKKRYGNLQKLKDLGEVVYEEYEIQNGNYPTDPAVLNLIIVKVKQ